VATTARAARAEFDVFLCCPDPACRDACDTLAAYLTRAGFRVYFEPEPGDRSDGARVAMIGSVSDFVLVLPPGGLGDSAAVGGRWHAEASAALATGSNVVRVSFAGAADHLPPDLPALASAQAVTYDPDRLAESLSVIQHCLSTDTIVNDRHMMRRTKRWFLFAGLLILAGFSAQTIPILYRDWTRPKPPPPLAPFVLHWSAFGERDAAGSVEEFALGPGAAVKGATGFAWRSARAPTASPT